MLLSYWDRLSTNYPKSVVSLITPPPNPQNVASVSIGSRNGAPSRKGCNAWSMVKYLKQATNEYALPPPPYRPPSAGKQPVCICIIIKKIATAVDVQSTN